MRFVEMLRQPKDAPKEVPAYLDSRFSNSTRKSRGLLDYENPEARILAQKQNGGRSSRECAANDRDVKLRTRLTTLGRRR
jgi:hypothetical protein